MDFKRKNKAFASSPYIHTHIRQIVFFFFFFFVFANKTHGLYLTTKIKGSDPSMSLSPSRYVCCLTAWSFT